MKNLNLFLICMIISVAGYAQAPAPIVGPSAICVGQTVPYSDATTGGTWSMSTILTATLGLTTGALTGVAAGTVTLTYTAPLGAYTTLDVTINPVPCPMAGPTSICLGSSATITGCISGGTWSSSVPAIASIDISSGMITTLASGSATITYTLATGCITTHLINVDALPTPFIVTGGGTYCAGGTGVDIGTNGSATGVVYQLYNGAGPVISMFGTGSPLDFGLQVSPGTYTVVASSGVTGCSRTLFGSPTITIVSLPAVFSVTGGGSYCTGGVGEQVGLSGSAAGVSYQLFNGATLLSAVAGTGSAIDFGYLTATGTYTVHAITTGATTCADNMSGSATVGLLPLPNVYTVTGGGSTCGGSGVLIGLDGSEGGVNYQLYRGVTPAGVPIVGTGGPISFGAQTLAGAYAVMAMNATTLCSSNMSGTATVGIGTGPTVYAVTGGGAYCTGGVGADVVLSNSDAGVSYQLFSGIIAVGSAAAGFGASIDFGPQPAGTYTVLASDGTSGCTATMTGSATVSVLPLPAVYTVTGGGAFCSGGTGMDVGLSGSAAGVSYQLFLGAGPLGFPVAGTGTALDFGVQTIAGFYTVQALNATTSCVNNMAGSASVSVSSLPSVHSVTGGGAYCAGGAGLNIGLASSNTGTNYQLYVGAAPVGVAMPGTGASLSFGAQTAAGTYTIVAANATTTCTADMAGSVTISIDPLPVPYVVTGGGAYCSGGTGVDVGLANSATGINYQLYVGAVTSGAVMAGSGASLGFGLEATGGTYTVRAINAITGCTSTMTGSVVVSVNPLPPLHTMIGGGAYCAGGAGVSVALDGSDIGINYQLYDDGTATGAAMTGTSSILGFGLHTVAGTYTVVATDATTTCTNNMTGSAAISINPLPTITATVSSVACDGSYTLTGGGATTYTWAPGSGLSCTGCGSATCNPAATTVYTVTGIDGAGCTGSSTVSVDGNRIMGIVTPGVSGTIQVWLVQFNPSDSSITALDSMTTCTSGSSQDYYFADPGSGNYLVKAYLLGGTAGVSGYIPTYGTSSPHWDAATTIAHTSASDNMNIAMIYGTVPPGPGFISGYVASGAGRNTSTAVPGMLIYLTDASGAVLTHTNTDATGNYTFSGLGDGVYLVYPEDFQFHTTVSPPIILSPASESVEGVNFKQLTTSKTITPYDYTVVKHINVQGGISVYPNPATDKLSISWANQKAGAASVIIADITGREVFKSAIDINAATGAAQIGLQGMKSGLYLLTIKNDNINYNCKLEIAD